MKIILDVDTRAISRNGWFWCADNHFTALILIEVVVVSAVAQGVFRSVEGFPNIYNPIGRGFVQGGVFKTIGLRVEKQDE